MVSLSKVMVYYLFLDYVTSLNYMILITDIYDRSIYTTREPGGGRGWGLPLKNLVGWAIMY